MVRCLQRPGRVLKRPNPTVDSGGYRAIVVFELAERQNRIPDQKQRIIGRDNNESQYFDRTQDYHCSATGALTPRCTSALGAVTSAHADRST